MNFEEQKNRKGNTDGFIHEKRKSESVRIRNAMPKVIPRTIRKEFGTDVPVQCYPPKMKRTARKAQTSKFKKEFGTDVSVQCYPPKMKRTARKVQKSKFKQGFSVVPAYSTTKERIKYTPSETHGCWTGERGNSIFISNDSRVTQFFDADSLRGIEYQDGMPDFSPFANAEVEIDNMTVNRYMNFKLADEKLAEQTGRSAKEVEKWREENNYTWHELNDARTMQLVPSKINAPIFKHLGGVGELKLKK